MGGGLISLLLIMPGCGPDPEPVDSKPASGLATRHVRPGCDPLTEAQRYVGLVQQRAFATLDWNRAPDTINAQRIPLRVLEVEGATVVVKLEGFPLADQYLSLWIHSGHFRPTEGGRLGLDPCSATLERR